MQKRIMTFVTVTGLIAASAALADEAISTRTVARPAEAVVTKAPVTDRTPAVSALSQDQVLAQISGLGTIERTRTLPFGVYDTEETLPDLADTRRIHTEMGASIGTGGYRSGFMASTIPLGDNGLLGIAIGVTDHGSRLYDYGYSPYGRHGGGIYGGTGTSRSLSISGSYRFEGAEPCQARPSMPDASVDTQGFGRGHSGCEGAD